MVERVHLLMSFEERGQVFRILIHGHEDVVVRDHLFDRRWATPATNSPLCFGPIMSLPDIPRIGDLRLIGRGGAADVYSGVKINLLHHEPVAVKVFLASLADEQTKVQFLSECEIYQDSRVEGLAVVRVPLANLTSDGRPYLVMELCTGSLFGRVADRGPLPWVEVARIGFELATALKGLRLPHGDVSPANILFRADASAVLSDFGLSVGRAAAQNLYTPEYAAPE
jgi:serine/threonine protein kinase